MPLAALANLFLRRETLNYAERFPTSELPTQVLPCWYPTVTQKKYSRLPNGTGKANLRSKCILRGPLYIQCHEWQPKTRNPKAVNKVLEQLTLCRRTILMIAVSAVLAGSLAQGAIWTTNTPMPSPCYWHSATLLPSGQVLIAGGYVGSDSTTNAELYNPATKSWTMTG